ncbi:uncharacterized protein LOC131327328 [Rhododendron vialii]|uniref:uncharacterized protein LOC131327328 n=1 Tax=Rhododendron vialii TaxID=182163 RepID=UPI002660510D|nr:uncharacterized protein LOC131327328 [Rhododendron vialii]
MSIPMGPPRFSSSMELERALAMDTLSDDDFVCEWGSISQADKAKAAAKARFCDIFDPNYEPWEEVHDALDLSDSESAEGNNSVQGVSSWSDTNYHRFQVGESSLSSTKMEVCEAMAADTLKAGSTGQCEVAPPSCVVSGGFEYVVESEKFDDVGKGALDHSVRVKWPRPSKYQRKKKVIMGRDFLLVSRNCLWESDTGRKFQFFHMASLSAVVVKVKEDSSVVKDVEVPLVSVSDPISPPLMEDDPLPLSSCVSDPTSPPQMEDDSLSMSSRVSCSPMPEPYQFSIQDSVFDRVGDSLHDTASGPQNLNSERIMALWRYQLDVCGPTSGKHPGNWKRKKMDIVKVDGRSSRVVQNPTQRKLKRERVIEDCCGDSHIYRIPQRRALH